MKRIGSARPSIRLFENEYLEKLTRVHPAIPAVIWLPIFFLCLWRSVFVVCPRWYAYLFAITWAFMAWTLTEYFLHRFLFHWKPRNQKASRVVFLFHGNHHAHPRDASRLVMPPIVSLFIGGSVYLAAGFVLAQGLREPFFAFYIIGYLTYDYCHYFAHTARGLTGIARRLQVSHLRHHSKKGAGGFGVTTPIWDYVLGTR